MFATCLAIILGLFIIYKLSTKNILKESLGATLTPQTIKIPKGQKKLSIPSSSKPLITHKGNALLLGGTQLYIFNTPEGAECAGRTQKERRHYYEDYEDIYQKRINRFPGESVRFDLLTPIPYSDAFVAPMGPHKKIQPTPTLSKITYPHSTFPYEA